MRLRLFVLLSLLALPGCLAGGLALEELPEQPIALIHWDKEAARRRAEILTGQSSTIEDHQGVARVEDLGRLLGATKDRETAGELARLPGRLSLVDPRTRTITRVAAAPPGSRPLAWSPDHQRLLYTSDRGSGQPQIFEYDMASGNIRRLTYTGRSYSAAAFGPEGRVVYFAWSRTAGEYRAAVYEAGPGGASPELLFEGEAVEDLVWSPDGTTLIYSRVRQERRGEVGWVLVARSLGDDPGEPRVLTRGRDPVLSPDGAWIVYSAPIHDGGWRLRRMRLDGSSRAPMGGDSLRDEREPAVSPDGQFVVYTGEEGIGQPQLFIRRFDGSGDRVLLTDGAMAAPVW